MGREEKEESKKKTCPKNPKSKSKFKSKKKSEVTRKKKKKEVERRERSGAIGVDGPPAGYATPQLGDIFLPLQGTLGRGLVWYSYVNLKSEERR